MTLEAIYNAGDCPLITIKPVRALAASLLLGVTACATVEPTPSGDLYYGFTLIDPATERRIENAYVLVVDDQIAEVGSGAPPSRLRPNSSHDLSGSYALPGFVDAHAHITAGPHRLEMRNGAPAVTIESDDEITRFQARVALAFGVTTVRNPGGDPAANARYDANIASGVWVGPEALHAGAVIQPPPFAGNAFAYPQNETEWQAEAARQAALGMTYFKLYQSLTEEEVATGIRAAHAHGLQAIAHLDGVSWTRAIELGVDGLEHALPTSPDLLEPEPRAQYVAALGQDSTFMYRWFELVDFDGPLMQEMIAAVARESVSINLTLVVNELLYNIDRLDEILPEDERVYMHPETLQASIRFLVAGAAGWTEEDYIRARAAMPRVLELAWRLHRAGAPMMIGTDGGGGGPSYARELELHAEAGIPVWDVLRMATSDAAAIMGLGERTGRLQPGFEADLVFLSGDPLGDLGNAAKVHAVMTDGDFMLSSVLLESTR